MLHGLYSSALAMDSAVRQQEVIAHNLAHANMPGYRRAQLLHGTFDDTFVETQHQLAVRSSQGLRGLHAATDWQPGNMKSTGRTLDVAIEGDGYFEIESPHGLRYTRNGSFELNDQGQLVTHDGLPVMGLDGSIRIDPEVSKQTLSISPHGIVTIGSQQVGQLKIVEIENKYQLTAVGVTLFKPSADAHVTELDPHVRAGYLEQANVQPVQELVELIATQRRHEAAARALHSIMQSIEKRTNLQGGN